VVVPHLSFVIRIKKIVHCVVRCPLLRTQKIAGGVDLRLLAMDTVRTAKSQSSSTDGVAVHIVRMVTKPIVAKFLRVKKTHATGRVLLGSARLATSYL